MHQVYLRWILVCGPQMEFCGCSGIMAPDGSELVRAGRRGDALLVSTIIMSDYDDYKKRNPYLTERRPELYSVITAQK
jgi:predicted amidohydrolase